jgi:hypothetical protein
MYLGPANTYCEAVIMSWQLVAMSWEIVAMSWESPTQSTETLSMTAQIDFYYAQRYNDHD